jgi:MFS transporter, MFS domain-containing protein family, molybdate-anion transporter
MVQFYELNLVLLVAFCLISLLLERHASGRKPLTKSFDHAEEGKAVSVPNGLASLTRQYLIVYAIVMGESIPPGQI